jgi:hypothetical protein
VSSTQEIADFAVDIARNGIDHLIELITEDPYTWEHSVDPELLLAETAADVEFGDRRTLEVHAALSLLMGARMAVFPVDLDSELQSDSSPGTRLWRIELVVESDDRDHVARIANAAARAACPGHDGDRLGADHTCAVPWMLMTSPLDGEEASDTRDSLNP